MRKLYLDDLARLAAVAVVTIRSYRSRGYVPEPDGVEIQGGHARPWWSEETAAAWLSNRPGQGSWGPRHARDVAA